MAFMAPYFGCAFAKEDIIISATNTLIEAVELSKDIIEELVTDAREVDERLNKAHKRMSEITQAQTNEITAEAFVKLDAVKMSLIFTGRKFRTLVERIETACEKLEINLDGWDDDVDNADKKIKLRKQV